MILGALYACQWQALIIIGGFFLTACFRKSYQPLMAGLLLYVLMNVDTLLLYLPKIPLFSSLIWNWQGKILEFILCLVLIYGFKALSPQQVGLNLPQNKLSLLYAIVLGFFFVLLTYVIATLSGPTLFLRPDMETMLYQATMPGLAEELLYRGVYLAILNNSLGKPWTIFNIKWGWGVIWVSLLFILVHVLQYDPVTHHLVLMNNYLDLMQLVLISFLLGFIREATGSIWPGVVFHNICNAAL